MPDTPNSPSTGWIMLPPPEEAEGRNTPPPKPPPLDPPPVDPKAEQDAYAELLRAFADDEEGTVVTALTADEFAQSTFAPSPNTTE